MRALLEAAAELGADRRESRYLAAVALAAHGGLRAGEIMRLRPEDLDARRRTLTLPVRSAVDQPKGRRERRVPIPASLVAALEACPVTAGEPWINRTWKYPAGLSRFLRPVWEAAGVSGGVGLHRLRHYWATELANGTPPASPYELMTWGGWSNVNMVSRYYHGPKTTQRASVDRLDRATIGPRREVERQKSP